MNLDEAKSPSKRATIKRVRPCQLQFSKTANGLPISRIASLWGQIEDGVALYNPCAFMASNVHFGFDEITKNAAANGLYELRLPDDK
jgi:hypothetical protein